MAQINCGYHLRAAGTGAARAVARAAVSPRASPSFAISRVHSSPRSCTFVSCLSTSARTQTTSHAELLRPSKNRRCTPTQIARRQSFHATAAVQQDVSELRERIDPGLLSKVADDLKHTSLTPLQALATELLSPERPDAVLQASPGSGKTLAFLLPALQRSIEQGSRRGKISALIVAPTREVGAQIYEIAQGLMKNHPDQGVIFVHGSNNKAKDTKRLLRNPDIVICTHMRLLDQVQDEKLAKALSSVNTIVVDDAERLIAGDHRQGLNELLQKIPHDETTTQTILTCANITPALEEFAGAHCRPGYKTISSPKDEAALHDLCQHELVELPDFQSVASGLAAYVKEETARGGPFKAIVYAPTTYNIDLYTRLLNRQKDLPPILTSHSKRSHGQRQKNTKAFRDAESAIYLSTDASVRGLNLPGVTTVIHVGAPRTKEDYSERLKHIAADGRSVLILAEPEKKVVDKQLGQIQFAPREVDSKTAESGIKLKHRNIARLCKAWISNYAMLRDDLEWNDEDLLREANALAKSLGADEPLVIPTNVAEKLGMDSKTPGLSAI